MPLARRADFTRPAIMLGVRRHWKNLMEKSLRIRRSLTIKQMATVSGVALATICFFIVIQLFHFVLLRRDDYAQQLQNIAKSVQQPLSTAMLAGDKPQTERILDTLKLTGILSRADML